MKITKFEAFLESAVPWFLIGVITVVLFMVLSCASYPNQSKVIKADKTKTAEFR